MRTAAIAVCVLATLALVNAQGPQPTPRFTLDLDADPSTRWEPIIKQFNADYGPIVAYLDQYYWPIIQPIFDPILADLDAYLPAPFADEIRGVAAAINGASGMDLGKVTLLNLLYDFSAFCTSIVAQDAQGHIVHGRNLDYPFPGLQNISISVDFQRNGVTQYTATTFAGYVGILTGMRPGGWSLTVNQRMTGESILSILKNFMEGVEGAYPIGMRIRETLETNSTFADAVETMQHVKLWGPVYLTMAGTQPNEGAIITRDRDDPADVWWIESPQNWYRGQTNDDHWKAPKDDRRDAMNAMMVTYASSNITTNDLWNVLSTPPVFNAGTRYTTTMNAAEGYFESMVRYDAPTKEQIEAEGWNVVFG